MPSLSQDIRPTSPLHKRIINGCQERIMASKRGFDTKHSEWRNAEDAAQMFIHESEIDAKRRTKRDLEGVPQYTTLYVPYSYGMLMTSHTYWTTVFLSRNPVLQFTGRHGEGEQQTQALEALMGYQTDVGKMLVPWYVWLYDAGKYGVGVLGTYWEEEYYNVSSIEEQEEMFLGMLKTGTKKKVKITKRMKGYEGNKNYNVRPFDFYPDPRVSMADFQKGEFCGVFRKIAWNTILRRADLGYYMNIDEIKPSKNKQNSNKGEEGSSNLERPGDTTATTTEFNVTDTRKTKQGNADVAAYEVYIDLIPADWGLGKGTLPEKWVFTITADFSIVFGACPLGANHDKFPFAVVVLEPEAYGILPRGMPEILKPIQDTVNWLINSHFYSVRKILNGQYLVDPSKVMLSDMLDPQHGGLIRLKPAGYGTNPQEAISQLTAVDVTQNHLRDINVLYEMGQRAVGVNDQLMGVLQSSGRKTATEVRSASTFGINRLKTNAEFFSAMGWAPHAQMMVQNSQQYFDGDLKFKIVGDLAMEAGPQFMQVNPETIGGFYDFVPVDGTLPVDRFAQANLWKELLMMAKQVPEIGMGYDLSRIFAWVSQLAGLKNINQFKVQINPMQQLAQGVQAGNLVPLPTGGGNPNEPKQIPNIGATG
jgi:hypothetical protein